MELENASFTHFQGENLNVKEKGSFQVTPLHFICHSLAVYSASQLSLCSEIVLALFIESCHILF